MRARRTARACGLALLAAGCAAGPDFKPPAAPAAGRYTQAGDPATTVAADATAQRFAPGAPLAADWWRLFGSPAIDGVVQQALAGNASLQAAEASLRQSEFQLRAGYGVFYPALDAQAAATRQRYSPLRVGQDVPGSLFNLFTASASISYALDVFGGQRRAVEALGAATERTRQTLLAAQLALTANVVNTMIARAAYAAEIDATRKVGDSLREQLRLAEARARAGTQPYVAVLSLRSQLASNDAAIPPLEQKRSEAEHLLAALVGQVPAAWTAPALTFDSLHLPETVPLSLPSELVRQRPDILAAEASLHAASANVGVATAALFPSLGLSASYGGNGSTPGNLFSTNGQFWSFGAALTAPVFEGGTLWFGRKAAIESYQQALANYRQTVLDAFAQVADVLRGLEHDAQALQSLDEAGTAAQQALRMAQANYAAGIGDYSLVLIADAQVQAALIATLETRALRCQDTVALFTALGGGWWNAPPADTQPATASN